MLVVSGTNQGFWSNLGPVYVEGGCLYLTGTVSGLRGLSFERSHNKQNGRPKKHFGSRFNFSIAHFASGLFSVYRTVVLHSTDSA